MAEEPLQSWLETVPHDDLQHMALLLYTSFPVVFGIHKTDAAAAVGQVLYKNERTIRRWIDDFVSNDGEFSESQQGHYVRNNTLMLNEEICEKARLYVRENAAPRGRPNLTARAFCQWVTLLCVYVTFIDKEWDETVQNGIRTSKEEVIFDESIDLCVHDTHWLN